MDPVEPKETSHRADKVREVAAGQETCTKKPTALKPTAVEKELCKETAPKEGIQKQTAPEKEPCKKTAPKEGIQKPTAPEKEPCKETAPKEGIQKPTAPEKEPCKETAPKEGIQKPTAPEKEPCKETAPKEGIKKQTAPEKELCKETSLIAAEHKETSQDVKTAMEQDKQKETSHREDKVREVAVGQETCTKKQTALKPTAPLKEPCKETAPKEGIQKPTDPEKEPCKETAPKEGIKKQTAPEKEPCKETSLIAAEHKETSQDIKTVMDQDHKETSHREDKVREVVAGQETCTKKQTALKLTSPEKEQCKETAPKDTTQKDLTQKQSTVDQGKDNETALKQENIKKTASVEGKLEESGHYEDNIAYLQKHSQTAQVEEKPKETSHGKETHTEMGKPRTTVQGQIKKESAAMQATTMEQKGEHVLKETGLRKIETTEALETLPETSHGKEAQKEAYEKQGIIGHAVPTEPETAQGWMDLCITEWALKDRKIPLPEGADWRIIYKKRPFGRNLLKSPNPEGLSTYQPPPQEECDPPPQRRPLETLGDFSGWTISTEEIPVDRSNVPPGVVLCYLPVYSWCVKEQLVDLVSEGLWAELLDSYQPYIYVLDWYEDSKLHRQEYELHVRLLAADRTTVIAHYNLTPENDMCGNPGAWIPVSHIFKSYGSGVRYVHFLHKSKDLSVLGFHRTRIADSTLFLQLKDLDSPKEPK